jgi:ketosteroid isomerase-like protein
MPTDNAEVVRRLYRAMDSRDIDAIVELADPDAEWVPDSRVGEGPVRGRENVIAFFLDRAEMFGDIRTDLERLWEKDDQVLAFIQVTGEGRASGAGFDIRIAHLWTLRDGVLVRGQGYGNRREALEAIGLSEEGDA